MYEDDAGPDVYAGMDVEPANAPLLPMPTAVPPPPLGSCEQRREWQGHEAWGWRHRKCARTPHTPANPPPAPSGAARAARPRAVRDHLVDVGVVG